MKQLFVPLLVATLALPAQAEPVRLRGRGPLTVIGLLGVAVGLGFGGASLASFLSVDQHQTVYRPYADTVDMNELPASCAIKGCASDLGLIQPTRDDAYTFAAVASISAGVGLLLLLADSIVANLPMVAVAPTGTGGGWAASLTGRF